MHTTNCLERVRLPISHSHQNRMITCLEVGKFLNKHSTHNKLIAYILIHQNSIHISSNIYNHLNGLENTILIPDLKNYSQSISINIIIIQGKRQKSVEECLVDGSCRPEVSVIQDLMEAPFSFSLLHLASKLLLFEDLDGLMNEVGIYGEKVMDGVVYGLGKRFGE